MLKVMEQSGPFMRNLLAYAASEVASKASRLFVVIVVARLLDPASIGLAAAAMAASDILKSLTDTGTVQRIIAAKEADLEATCNTAHRIFWSWSFGLFVLQVTVGAVLFALGGSLFLFTLIVVLAAEYLFMPGGLVNVALAMRDGKLKQTAAIAGAQVVGANFFTVILVLIWPNALALVLPRLLSAPIWLIAVRRLRPWAKDKTAGYAPLMPFIKYGWAVLGVEVVKATRLQIDKLLVGALMGAEALGIYFLAFNAGLGLATSFSFAFSNVVFPHLIQATDRIKALRQAILLAMGLIAPIVVLQALLAPVYVPILFGEKWTFMSDIVSILCLAAIPALLWAAVEQHLRAQNRPQVGFWMTAGMTIAIVLNTLILAPHGLLALAIGYLVVMCATQIAASLPTLITAFRPQTVKV
ncbi:MAG: oligosaccharide flippase family protein [Planktomarina sp.]